MIYQFKNGLTVKELKHILQDWPDKPDSFDPEEESTVWIEQENGLSSIVTSIITLNQSDILFISND